MMPLRSAWYGGSCSISCGTLEYSSASKSATIELELVPESPDLLLCSKDHTAILDRKNAKGFVSLGADGILSGTVILGLISGSVSKSNVFSFDLKGISIVPKDISGESISHASLKGDDLVIVTNVGKTWKLDCINPGEWRRY